MCLRLGSLAGLEYLAQQQPLRIDVSDLCWGCLVFRVLFTFMLSSSCPGFSGFNDLVLGGLFVCYILISIFLSLFSCYRDICSIFRNIYSSRSAIIPVHQPRGAVQQSFLIHLSSCQKRWMQNLHVYACSPTCFLFFILFIHADHKEFIQHVENVKAEIVGLCLTCLSFIHINKACFFFSWVVGYFCLVSFCLSFYSSHQSYSKQENHFPRVHFGCPALLFSLFWPLEIALHACLAAHNAGFLQYERMF